MKKDAQPLYSTSILMKLWMVDCVWDPRNPTTLVMVWSG